MIEISKNISVDGFDTKEEFSKWLEEQEQKESNENVLKTFKWFLIKIEKADKNKVANMKDCEALEKYANKVIDRKLMSIDNVLKYMGQAMNAKEETNETL